MGIPEFEFDATNGPFIKIKSDNGTVRNVGLTDDGSLTCDGHPVIEQEDTSYDEYVYSGNYLSVKTIWVDNTKTQKIKEESYTYTANRMSQLTTDYYDANGVKFKTVTEVLTYNTKNQLESIDRTVS